MNSQVEPSRELRTVSADLCCFLCGSPAMQPASPRYSVCSVCGTLSQFPPPAAVQFEESGRYEHDVLPHELRWLELLEDMTVPTRSVLDLGAGNGSFIEAATKRGWQAHGLEGCAEMVQSAQAAGRKVVQQDLDSWEHSGSRFGVIRIWFVLEHVRYPGRVLTQAMNALLPQGILLMSIPNDAGWLSRLVMRTSEDRFWEHPLHLHHFPPFGLEDWLRQHGFELAIGESGRPTELMREGNLPLFETWERIRQTDPGLSRLFYQLGIGRTREMIFRSAADKR